MDKMIQTAVERIDRAYRQFKPKAIIALVSGGHDSLSALFVAKQHPNFTAALTINTGTGIPATLAHTKTVCGDCLKCPLYEYKARENKNAKGKPDPQIYEDLVLTYGFPGGGHHKKMYNRLKERQLRQFEREIGASSKTPVLYVSGCRSQESKRRMGNTKEVQKLGRRLWVAAIHDWSKIQTGALLSFAKLPRNPVVDLIHRSGECNCGAMADGPQELAEMALWPETKSTYEWLVDLQVEVRKKFPWGWGENQPPWWKEKNQGQRFMMDFDNQHLCWSCNRKPRIPQEPRELST